MFSIIYEFRVKTGQQQVFEKSWVDLTQLIYNHSGSLGSRLHKLDACTYIAYAQWPDKETWKNAANRLPQESSAISALMKESCISIETLHELEIVKDLLKVKPLKGDN
jgi:heme-degrading monooxygenase HmoA